jgi:HPt (histidine-containing phosphotransfer) domain-containing protein
MNDPGESPLQEHAIATLWDIAGGSTQIFQEIIDDYMTMAKQVVSEIEGAIATNDARATAHAAHSLKGSSAMMGAHLVQKTTEAIERAAVSGDLGAARALLPVLGKAHEATLAQLLLARDEPAPDS